MYGNGLNWNAISARKLWWVDLASSLSGNVKQQECKIRATGSWAFASQGFFAKSGACGTPSLQFRRCKTSNLLAKILEFGCGLLTAHE
jgi:hypothetical protein